MSRELQTMDMADKNGGLSSIIASDILTVTPWKTLGESMDLFSKSLKLGRVRGIVTITGLTNSGSRDPFSCLQLTRELIKRDILVTISGSEPVPPERAGGNDADFLQGAGDGLAEFCDFIGIEPVLYFGSPADSMDMPGFCSELSRHAGVDTVDLPAAAVLPRGHEAADGNTATVFTMEDDPVKTADLVDEHIHHKRLGVRWCDRCDCRFSPFS